MQEYKETVHVGKEIKERRQEVGIGVSRTVIIFLGLILEVGP
jgi:hypothetical protein